MQASLRGSSSEQVLVLVDGERINDARSGIVDLDNVPVTHAKRIEIVRGGQSAIYGADAVGGVINIITRQPTGTTARAWSTLGSYDSLSWGLEASKRVKTLSGLISFSRAAAESDFPFEDKYGREFVRENADFTKRNVFGRLKWNVSRSLILRLSGDYFYSDKGDPGAIGQSSPDATKQDESNGLRANMEQILGEGTFYKLSVYRRDATLRYINPQQPYPVDDTHETRAVGGEMQMHFLQSTAIPLVGGFSLRNDDIASTALGDEERETFSGYLQQELGRDLSGGPLRLSRIAVFPALRWDHYSDFEAGMSPRVGFLASFGRERVTSVKANIGRSYRAPTLNDLYWPPDAFAVGNPDLKPEKSRDVDAGIHVHLRDASLPPALSEVRCAVSYFRSSFEDRIQWTPGAEGKWSPQNLSEAHSAGLETEARVRTSFWNMPDLVSLGASYTYLRAQDALERQLIYRPKHSLGYSLRLGTRGFWGQIQGLYQSRRYYTVENTKWLDPFRKHDLQVGVERRLRNIANVGFTLEVKNIFDNRQQLVADYPLPGREWSFRTSIGMEGE